MIIATLYCHPLEFVIGNFFPLFSGLILLKSNLHAVTLSVWALFRLIFTFEEHCGFDFPFHLNKALPFLVSSEHHSFHHEKNVRNYGQFTWFWDRIFGTETAYLQFKNASASRSESEKIRSKKVD